MLKRAALTFTELALWVPAISIFVSGCTPSGTGNKAAPPAKPPTAATPDPANPTADKPNSMDNIPLIPREVLFGNPQRAQARLSPDGKWLSFQAPVDGVLNIWVGPADDLSKAKPVTDEKVRPDPDASVGPTTTSTSSTCRTKTATRTFTSTPPNVDTGETQRPHADRRRPRRDCKRSARSSPTKFSSASTIATRSYHDIWRVNIADRREASSCSRTRASPAIVTDDDTTSASRSTTRPPAARCCKCPRRRRRRHASGKTSSNSAPKTP